MKNKYKKKLIKVFSVFVSLLMVFALVPVTANATEKTKDDIKIANGDTVYGTFSWSKQHAGTSAYARDIEIYVNGEHAYTKTVNTPKELSNLIGVNKEFWFEPNLDLYNANYEMNRDYVNQVEKDLKIYLTTKCGCGFETCLCEGGCDCRSEEHTSELQSH